MSEDYPKAVEKAWSEYEKVRTEPKTCPYCGRCPHCGQPWPQPFYPTYPTVPSPYPTYPIIW